MKKSAKKKLSALIFILWGLAALLFFDLGSHLIKSIRSINETTGSFLTPPVPKPLEGTLSKKERLILQGDISQKTPAERWLALHEFDPENPVYYAHYLNQLDELPKDYHPQIAKIDPENGWFLYLEAAQSVKGVIEKGEKLNRIEKKKFEAEGLPSPPKKLIITNPEKVSERLALLEKAVSFPKWDSYRAEISEERFDALPEAHDVLGGIKNLTLIGEGGTFLWAWKNALELTSSALQAAKTKEEFLRLEALILKLEERSFEEIETLAGGLIYQAVLSTNSGNLYHSAERVGLEEKAQLYQERELILHRRSQERRTRSNHATEELFARRGSILSFLSSPAIFKMVNNPPQITQAMLHPDLRAERAVVSRGLYGFIFMILSVGALSTWIYKRKKENPVRFQPELSTLALGVLLPFAVLIFFRYFLSFGMLDYGGNLMAFGNYLLPEIATLLILFATPLCLLRTKNHPYASRLKIWCPLGILVISLLLSSAMIPLHDLGIPRDVILFTPLALMIAALLRLIFPGLQKTEPLFDLTSRLAPAYLFAAALSGFFILALQAEERHWFAQEGYIKPSPKGFTVMESQVVDILKKELEELKAEIR